MDFTKLAKTVNECFHAYGIHSVTLQPELVPVQNDLPSSPEVVESGTVMVTFARSAGVERVDESLVQARKECQLGRGNSCGNLSCCQ